MRPSLYIYMDLIGRKEEDDVGRKADSNVGGHGKITNWSVAVAGVRVRVRVRVRCSSDMEVGRI